jgi:hypothetical protein
MKKKILITCLTAFTLMATGCMSMTGIKKLDLSTVDKTKPVLVTNIHMVLDNSGLAPMDGSAFFAKYGDSLKNSPDTLKPEDYSKLLSLLCGSVAGNWDFIRNTVKNKTGITLTTGNEDTDNFMTALKSGDADQMVAKNSKTLGTEFYYYDWNASFLDNPDGLSEITANIDVSYDAVNDKIIPTRVVIAQGEVKKNGVIITAKYDHQAFIDLAKYDYDHNTGWHYISK